MTEADNHAIDDGLEDIEQLRRATEERPEDSQAWLELGLHHSNRKRFDEAIPPLQRAVEVDKNDPSCNLWLGLVLGKAGRSEEALTFLRATLELTDERSIRSEAWTGISGVLNDLGARDDAVYAMMTAIKLDPADPNKRALLGILLDPDCCISFGQAEKTALKRLGERQTQASEADHGSTTPLQEAIRARVRGDVESALGLLREAIQTEPDDPLLYIELGDLLSARGEPFAAAKSYVQAGQLFLERNDRGHAYDTLRRAVQTDPGHAEAWYHIGRILRTEGELDDAKRALRQSLRLRRKDPKTMVEYGAVLCSLGELKQAEKQLRRAIDLDSTSEAWFYLGLTLTGQDRFEIALEAFEESDTLARRSDSRVIFAIGYVQFILGRRKEARERLREVIEAAASDRESQKRANRRLGHILRRKASSTNAWLMLAEIFGELNRPWEQEMALRRAIRVDEGNARAWYELYMLPSPTHEREHALDMAYLADNNDPDIVCAQGISFYEHGMKKDALDLFEEALDIDPDHRDARRWADFIEREFEELEAMGHSPRLGFYGGVYDPS